MLIIWLVLAAVFVAVEFATVALISLWFAAGALAALVLYLLGAALWLQILGFALVSLAMLLLARPFLRRHVDPYKVPTNVDALPGKEAVVLDAIDNLTGRGTVRLEGKIWTARSADGRPIDAGTVVRVQSIEGVKALVLPAHETRTS